MSCTHLTIEEREAIAKMIFAGESKEEIAKDLNRSPSTIGQELKRNQDSRINTLPVKQIAKTLLSADGMPGWLTISELRFAGY